MASNDKSVLIGRLSGTAGKGTGANTGLGTADVLVPEFPILPSRITEETARQFRQDVERWRSSFQAQFPIPLPTPDTFDPTGLQSQIDSVLASVSALQASLAQLQADSGTSTDDGECHCTKADVGLGNVDNTSDLAKPISSATQSALDGKSNVGHTHTGSQITDLGTMAYQNSDDVNITGGVIEGYYSLHSAAVWEFVKNTSGSTIAKGTPVYIVSRTGTHIDVAPADAANSAKMPAIGVAQDQIAIGSNGYIHVIGTVTGVNTSTATLGQTVYVAAGGGFTLTKPFYPNLIQNIGRVTKVANNGEVLVLGPGRTNDVPALSNKTVFIGNSSGNTDQRALTVSDITGLDPNAYNETDFLTWSRCIYVPNTASAQQTSLGYGASDNGTASNVAGTATEMLGRNWVSAASIGSTFGWSSGAIFISDHEVRHYINAKISTDTTSMRFWVGLASTTLGNLSSDTPNQHLAIFRYSSEAPDTNWKAVTCAGTGSSSTVTDTGVAVGTSAKTFGIVYTPSEVKFYINATLVATHTTNIPATGQTLRVHAGGVNVAAAARNCRVYWANGLHRLQ